MLRGFDCITLHIVKVFFRKSLNENVVVFNAKGRYGTTLTSCRFMRIGAFYALNTPYLLRCGVLCRLF